MAQKKADLNVEKAGTPGLARLIPTQKRSRERFERILACAAEIMSEKGSDALRMSDIVERTGVPFGSLYQYFPDKTAIIGTLAERNNAIGRVCVEAELAPVNTVEELHPALCRVVDGYYGMFREMPIMHDIWQATQADRALQELDSADMEFLAGILFEALHRVDPDGDARELRTIARLIMHLMAAAVRHAITHEPPEAEHILALFKRMMPVILGKEPPSPLTG